MAVVVTVAKGYDLGYVWKNQAQNGAEKAIGGYYINAAQAGEPPGRWWGPGAKALGFTPGQERALQKALVLVSTKHPVWTRHDLLKQLALVMPPETRHMDAEAVQELLLGLAEEALSGRAGEVVCLEAPQWPPLPGSLRRELDGRSVYTRPGVARYATAAQLSMEE